MTRIAAPSTAAGNSDAYGFVPFTARPLPGRPIRVVVEHGGKPAVACASASQNQSEPAVSKPPPLGRYLRPTGPRLGATFPPPSAESDPRGRVARHTTETTTAPVAERVGFEPTRPF